MPGIVSFRPVEANLTHDTNWLGKMDPYCKFSHGTSHAQSSVCRHGGTRPHWGDTVNLTTSTLSTGLSNIVRLEIFDKDKFRPDDHIAYTDIDLTEIEQRGSISKWYPLYHHKKPAGEILIEAALQQQQMYVQNVVPTTTYVQETIVTSNPVQGVVGESYVIDERIVSQNVQTGGFPLNQNIGLVGSTNLGSYTTTSVDPNLYGGTGLTGGNIATNPTPGTFSKVSALGPSGGLPHGYHALKGATNTGYSERPGYTLGDTEANPTCQSNLDSNGGGFFNKPGREKRTEPYSLSNPGTYGIPHGQTIDTAGHLRPDVNLQRQAPIGTVNHPGITGYVDGYNVPQQQLQGQGLYNTGLNSGLNQGGLGAGSYGTGLGSGLGQQGSYGTGLSSNLGQQGLGQGTYGTLGQQNLVQGNLINSLGGQGLGQQGYGQVGSHLGQQTTLGQQGLQQGYGQVGTQLGQQGLNQQVQGNLGPGSLNTGLQGETRF